MNSFGVLTLLQESLKMLSFSIWAVAIHVNDHALVINEVHQRPKLLQVIGYFEIKNWNTCLDS